MILMRIDHVEVFTESAHTESDRVLNAESVPVQ